MSSTLLAETILQVVTQTTHHLLPYRVLMTILDYASTPCDLEICVDLDSDPIPCPRAAVHFCSHQGFNDAVISSAACVHHSHKCIFCTEKIVCSKCYHECDHYVG